MSGDSPAALASIVSIRSLPMHNLYQFMSADVESQRILLAAVMDLAAGKYSVVSDSRESGAKIMNRGRVSTLFFLSPVRLDGEYR